jgi:hypothetical protein
MSITRKCNGCGEIIPAESAGALTAQRDRNPGIITAPSLAALDRTDWCTRCAAPILAAIAESLIRARQARERRAMAERAANLDLSELPAVAAARKNLPKKRHLRLTT